MERLDCSDTSPPYSIRAIEKFTSVQSVQNSMHKLMTRILFWTDLDFRHTASTGGFDISYTKRALFSFALYHFPDNECLDFLDPVEADYVLRTARLFVVSFNRIVDEAYAYKDMRKVNRKLRRTFGETVYDFFKVIGSWCEKYHERRVAKIFDILQFVCEKGDSSTGRRQRFTEAKIQELREESQELGVDTLTFDVRLKKIQSSISIMKRLRTLYDNTPSPKNSDRIESLRKLYKGLNGPDSLQRFDHTNKKKAIKQFKGVTQKFNQDVEQQLHQLSHEIDAATLRRETLKKQECVQQILAIYPELSADRVNADEIWQGFQQTIQGTHDLIHQIKAGGRPVINMAFTEDVMHPANCKWAKLHDDMTILRMTDDDDHSLFPANNYIAHSILKHKPLDYKATEHTLLASSSSGLSTVFDLGDAYSQFRHCKLIYRIVHGLCSMALVETRLAPYLVFTKGDVDCRVHLSAANKTIRVTAECLDGVVVAEEDHRLSVVLVEIKFCAMCGKQAKKKCDVCWDRCRACIRYCSKECFRADYRRHKAVCGRDFSDEWESVSQ